MWKRIKDRLTAWVVESQVRTTYTADVSQHVAELERLCAATREWEATVLEANDRVIASLEALRRTKEQD